MSDETENDTLRLLQEIRAEMRERFDRIDARFAAIDERFDGVEQRLDGNTLLLNIVAGITHDHERRINALEARPA